MSSPARRQNIFTKTVLMNLITMNLKLTTCLTVVIMVVSSLSRMLLFNHIFESLFFHSFLSIFQHVTFTFQMQGFALQALQVNRTHCVWKE